MSGSRGFWLYCSALCGLEVVVGVGFLLGRLGGDTRMADTGVSPAVAGLPIVCAFGYAAWWTLSNAFKKGSTD